MSKNLKKKKRSIASIVIIVSLIILAIPASLIAYTGITSLMSRGKPIVGKRFSNDLDPKIDQKSLDTIEKELSVVLNDSKVSVTLKSATLRVSVLDETLTEGNMLDAQETIYGIITATLPEEEYFTKSGTKKQYDLEINTFNQLKVTEETQDSYVYGEYIKNSGMKKPQSQLLSKPISQDLVDYFWEQEELNNKEPEIKGDSEIDDIIGEGEE